MQNSPRSWFFNHSLSENYESKLENNHGIVENKIWFISDLPENPIGQIQKKVIHIFIAAIVLI